MSPYKMQKEKSSPVESNIRFPSQACRSGTKESKESGRITLSAALYKQSRRAEEGVAKGKPACLENWEICSMNL
ncbi:hypothetical protein [Herbaspirillum sp. ST 5-3]|uniref:hypothetical protein n=1 Tax=Oxalobacteraceae TaxID=75682 RepID=UPI0010A4F164|nr:hypothetical protein [Herbaspirillum sp. ST 5-3]